MSFVVIQMCFLIWAYFLRTVPMITLPALKADSKRVFLLPAYDSSLWTVFSKITYSPILKTFLILSALWKQCLYCSPLQGSSHSQTLIVWGSNFCTKMNISGDLCLCFVWPDGRIADYISILIRQLCNKRNSFQSLQKFYQLLLAVPRTTEISFKGAASLYPEPVIDLQTASYGTLAV